LIDVYQPDVGEYPIDIEERKDINPQEDVYREAIKKLKFSSKDNGMKIKMQEISQYSVYSNQKK